MQSMDRSPSSVGEFYARRAFRIYPLSIAVVVLVLALQIPRNPAVSFVWPGWKAVVANLLLVQNLFDYKSIANPMWSLPYEVQMYLSLPIIYRVLRAASYRAWAVAGWWAGAWGASLLASYLPHGNLVYYAPCFMGGIVGFALLKSRPIAEERRIGAMAGAALLVVITGGFCCRDVAVVHPVVRGHQKAIGICLRGVHAGRPADPVLASMGTSTHQPDFPHDRQVFLRALSHAPELDLGLFCPFQGDASRGAVAVLCVVDAADPSPVFSSD